jgi:aspartyl-tRNA(Asn)/glutamyl-tRNA(Gln) amidotransferase subunit B
MRVKESANDYRYFPEPDLPPFRTDEAFLASVEEALVELPPERTRRFAAEYGLSEAQAHFICDERETADFFEQTVQAGAAAAEAAVWLMGDVQKLLNRTSTTLGDSPLTPMRFAELLRLLDVGRIHGKLAKQTLAAVFEDDEDPSTIIAERGWEQITDPEAIGKIVDGVLAENAAAVEQIRGGDSKPHGYLVGQVMRATSGRADPKLVQRVLGERLALKFIRVFSFGGAISGRTREDGTVVPGTLDTLIEAVRNDPTLPNDLRYSELELGGFLSEEITPRDWASLVHAVATHVASGDTSGIVIATGTDTISYTAGLLHWLFGEMSVPVVLVASSTTGETGESTESFKQAVRIAVGGSPGVSVVFAGERLPAVNLKFERVPGDSEDPAFRTWNARDAARTSVALYGNVELSQEEIATRMEAAVKRSFVAKIFPGMQASSLIALIDAGVRFFVLELYDTGTANVRETPFSLRDALEYGHERGVVFFCTSQQEGNVDFSTYITSHDLWRGGAIPMGTLTTESVYSRLLAVLLTSDDWDGETISKMMEQAE